MQQYLHHEIHMGTTSVACSSIAIDHVISSVRSAIQIVRFILPVCNESLWHVWNAADRLASYFLHPHMRLINTL